MRVESAVCAVLQRGPVRCAAHGVRWKSCNSYPSAASTTSNEKDKRNSIKKRSCSLLPEIKTVVHTKHIDSLTRTTVRPSKVSANFKRGTKNYVQAHVLLRSCATNFEGICIFARRACRVVSSACGNCVSTGRGAYLYSCVRERWKLIHIIHLTALSATETHVLYQKFQGSSSRISVCDCRAAVRHHAVSGPASLW